MTPGLLKPGEFEFGDEVCDGGVGRNCGDWLALCEIPGSSLGAIAELERLA